MHRTRLGHMRQRCQVRIFQQVAHLESSNLLRCAWNTAGSAKSAHRVAFLGQLVFYRSHLMFTQIVANFGKIDDARNTLTPTTPLGLLISCIGFHNSKTPRHIHRQYTIMSIGISLYCSRSWAADLRLRSADDEICVKKHCVA